MNEQTLFRSPAGERAMLTSYDGMLAHWPSPYKTRRLVTRHAETFVVACGRHYRFYAVDLLGEAGRC